MTPGPWTQDKATGMGIHGAQGVYVAQVWRGAHRDANAQAIAALPDCIEALQGMLADVEAWQNNPHGQTPDGHVSKARRALKKAGCL